MSSHLEQALSTLTQTPFDKLRDDEKEYILKLKRDLPFDDELAQHLAELGLSALLPYLVWIPFSMFIGGIRKLGQGGFATVYKGTLRYTDGDSGKVVKQDFALKEVDVSMLQEIVMSVIMNIKGNIWRCFARTLGLTSRPESGKFLLVMEYAAGGSLEHHFQKNSKAISWRDIVCIAWGISLDLSRLHDTGLAHGDYHPGNIVFFNNNPDNVGNNSGIIDVGLSRIVTDAATDDFGCYGRLPYLPPESFTSGARYTQESDIYCLGTILWQLVSRVPPRGTAGNLFREDGLREDPVPGTPEAYQSIINDCWNIDPSKRPTAAEVSRHLYVYRASLKIYSRGWLPGTTPLRIFYHKYIRHPPSPETKAYVSRRVTEHHRNLKAEQNGDSDTFTFVSGMSSASSLAHRSQYYTRSQLAEFSQSLTSAALKKVPESPLTADSAKTS